MKQRIWELDAVRGLCLLLMIYCHIVYDLTELFAVVKLKDPTFYNWAMDYTGIFFLTLSGISVTLGNHPVKRGLTVIGGGMLCSIATYFLYRVDFAPKSILIYFGILHCLGVCMLLWPLLRKLPFWVLGILGAGILLINLPPVKTDSLWLLPFGIRPARWASSDYFPLVPYLGYFLIGSAAGKLLYKNKKSLLPACSFFPIPQLCFMGRHSLLIYLLHQPILAGIIAICVK